MNNDSTDIMTGNSNEIRPHPSENEGVWVGVGEASELYDNFLELKRQEYLASGHLTKFYEDFPEYKLSNKFSERVKYLDSKPTITYKEECELKTKSEWLSNKFPKTGSQKISQKN